ncbi:nuclear transport factor 2 family protein [Streptomyces sp. NPDC050619]|uniref:nuclear transport factor 2 family protein n=1 Tax=Streptomyces sp. NPDC050619 TaxID=3157214 RepID=UPI003418A82A
MTMEQNKQVAQDFLHAVGQGDVAAVDKLLADDFTWRVAAAVPESHHPLPAIQTREEFLAGVSGMRDVWVDGLVYRIHGVLADGDKVAIEASGEGSTLGLDFRNRYCFFLELRDGLVAGGREYLDFAYLKAFQARMAERMSQTG